MRFGLFTSMGMQTWPGVLDLWRHLEATGWDVACVTDHFMPNTKEREGAMLECWSTLSALAALVPRMRVGTIVLGNTYRHPAVLAKMAAQVDIISGGRLLLGMGAGWQQNEHEAYGIPFYTMRERLERLDEACQVMRSLWTQDAQQLQGPLLPALRRAARSQAGADAASRADDRRRRRAGHAAHRGPARRSLERLGRARRSSPARARSSTSTAQPSVAIPRPSPARSTWRC